MPGKPLPSGYFLALQVLMVIAAGDLAHAQLGQRYSRPSNFYLPSQQLGILGGQYTRYDNSALSSPAALSAGGGPLSLDLSAGSRSISRGAIGVPVQGSSLGSGLLAGQPTLRLTAQSSSRLSGRVSAVATTPGLTLPGYPSPPSVPQAAWFQPVLSPDLIGELPDRRRIDLDKIVPEGLSPGAIEAAPQAAAAPAMVADPGRAAGTLKELVRTRATQMNQQGEQYLAQGIEALKAGRIRSNRNSQGDIQWGAVDWFDRARLLAGDRPDPTLGLIASLVSVSDCSQAAAMVGPLVRRWPDVLTDPVLFSRFYVDTDQARMHLLIVRKAAASRPDPDLRLLAAFYSWFAENRQQALNDVELLARSQEPNSLADAVAKAMRAGLAGQTP